MSCGGQPERYIEALFEFVDALSAQYYGFLRKTSGRNEDRKEEVLHNKNES